VVMPYCFAREDSAAGPVTAFIAGADFAYYFS
jgi:hypothetical protein